MPAMGRAPACAPPPLWHAAPVKRTWAGLLAVLGFAVSGCQPAGNASVNASAGHAGEGAVTVIRHADAAAAQKLLADGKVTVLDIRTPQEFAAGHIAGAKLVDFNSPDFKTRLSELDRSQPYLLHCASGRRSTKALETVQTLGFKEVIHLDGGFNAWKAGGQPVAR